MLRTTILILTAVTLVAAYSAGPPDRKTGRPGEGTCADCHSNTGSGDSTTLTGFVGGSYNPGALHTLTLTVNYMGQVRWGFEMTAVDASMQAAGQFVILDSINTQLSSSGGLQYVKQTTEGTLFGNLNGSWTIGWRAPDAGAGTVSFYWCANAADGNNGASGDYALPSMLDVVEPSGISGEENGGALRRWFRVEPGRSRVIIEYRGDDQRPVGIYAKTGRRVRVLGPEQAGDMLRVEWDGRDADGEQSPEGSYFVRFGDGIDEVVKVRLVR